MNPPTVRVVIVDDHPVVRSGLRGLLETMATIEVAGEAGGGAEALDVVTRQHPDVVLMDLQMAGMDGLSATRRIAAEHPATAVLVVTMFDDQDTLIAAVKAGARGYILKGAEPSAIRRAIEAVSNGDAIFGPELAEHLASAHKQIDAMPIGPIATLTSRERQILHLVADGANNAAIASRLAISIKTVCNHVSNILTKLHATDRPELIVRARRAGLGHD